VKLLGIVAGAWLVMFGFVGVCFSFWLGYTWFGPWGLLAGIAALATYSGVLAWWAVDR
jgi:hypothetical protein